MSDAKVRSLERRWLETRAPNDELAWLRERLRVGELDHSRLELAAHCRHSTAQALLRELDRAAALEPAEPHGDESSREFALGLLTWGDQAVLRAALAAVRLTVRVFEREQPGVLGPRPLMEAAESWLQEPSEACRERVQQLRSQTHFRRARYAHAASCLLEAILAETSVVLAGGLAADRADQLHEQLERLGTVCRVESEPEGSRRQVVRLARRRNLRLDELRTLLHGVPPGLSKSELIGASHTRVDWALASIESAADPVWAKDGLGDQDIQRAIQQEVVVWSLGLPSSTAK